MFKVARMYHAHINGKDVLRVMHEARPELNMEDLRHNLYKAFGLTEGHVEGAIPFQMPPTYSAICEYYNNDPFIFAFIDTLLKEANVKYNEVIFINMP